MGVSDDFPGSIKIGVLPAPSVGSSNSASSVIVYSILEGISSSADWMKSSLSSPYLLFFLRVAQSIEDETGAANERIKKPPPEVLVDSWFPSESEVVYWVVFSSFSVLRPRLTFTPRFYIHSISYWLRLLDWRTLFGGRSTIFRRSPLILLFHCSCSSIRTSHSFNSHFEGPSCSRMVMSNLHFIFQRR